MIIDVLQKQRPINWLRFNRLFLNKSFYTKFFFLKNLYKFFYRIKTISFGNFYFYFLNKNKNNKFKNKINLFKNFNISTQFVNKCFYGGYSNGIRFSVSRLNILNNTFKGKFNSIGIARW